MAKTGCSSNAYAFIMCVHSGMTKICGRGQAVNTTSTTKTIHLREGE